MREIQDHLKLLVPTRNLKGSHLSFTANASRIHFAAFISEAGFVKSKTATITVGIERIERY